MGRTLPWLAGNGSSPDKRSHAKGHSPNSGRSNSSRPHTGEDDGRLREKVPSEPMRPDDDRYIMIVEELDEVCGLVAAERYRAKARGMLLDQDMPSDRSVRGPENTHYERPQLPVEAVVHKRRREDAAYMAMLVAPVGKPGPELARSTSVVSAEPARVLSRPQEPVASSVAAPAPPARTARPAPPPPKPQPPPRIVKKEDEAFNLDFMFDDGGDVSPVRPIRSRTTTTARTTLPKTPSPTDRSRLRSAFSVSPEPTEKVKVETDQPPRKKTVSLARRMAW